MIAPAVSVIVVSYGTRDLTLASLRSVRVREHEAPLEVVVVDNASPDDSADAVEREHPWATLVRARENRGFAAGANLGARNAAGEWLLFLNSDARLTDGALATLLGAGRAHPRPGALGPRIEGPDGQERSVGRFFGPWRDFVRAFHLFRLVPRSARFEEIHARRFPADTAPVEWLTGACLLVRRDVFEEVGGFDEAFFLYVEDMDLCYRLVRSGRTNLYVPSAIVIHEQGKSPKPINANLVEGGDAAEYFVRKHGIRYPVILQRTLRGITLAGWIGILAGRILRERLRGKSTAASRSMLARCGRSLTAIFRPRSTLRGTAPGRPTGPQ